ncbi:MAG: acyltransferase [Microcoleus sp. PH2017_29_MFU_D_A]|jgi:exopolysaccharide production protein ExoZ|uniref:acyltransferase family protein n=1 Tax=unclassified Microcoleus TaxID=2642155 RepID=UPI001D3A5433|nr:MULTISPECIES: acyltransferase [unclassified Microcoleus]MCC3416796.1 acyltransferase [Microcoleus sp. PH2017_07_MST_O_A]MCC3432339.1 acyltransferase [Microcoleus sp. PH2017_04_SCI_O_A]MCC3442056.1 acyltransferase [Microcoleus sp. PH2017_03_ELD_O_A]MCC3502787.1 acyltransferase [Microcoleus sp. PH2017_19_SFW_U_A]MCC3509820.1 acyltransferase [Microcoleus sp. PH2017_17_BER_D_A]TAE08964.1 MAG: acyltransferase [Oscillatoriales cyanobacterium]
MTKSSNPHKKLNLLQVYRGIGALLVVMFHVNQMSTERLNQVTFFNLFQAGWSGVDYFFVLSGFIMVYVHRSAIGKKDQLKSFLVKRCVRIYPIYWIITLTVVFFFLLIPGFANAQDLSLDKIILSLLLIPQYGKPILDVGWTLVYEIYFYVLFSIAIWLKPKQSVPLLSAWLFVTFLHFSKVVTFPDAFFLLNLVFGNMNLEFVLGGLAAYIVLKYNNKITNYRWILFGIANLGYVILGLFVAWGNIEFDRIKTFAVLAAILIVAATSIDLKDSPRLPYLLIFLGDASYSIFLLHSPVISATTKIVQKANLGKYFDGFFAPAMVALFAVVVGCIFYSFIEKPLTVYLRKNIVEKMFLPKAQAS